MTAEPLLPDYAGACIANIVPALLGPADPGPWFPAAALQAEQVVLLVLDGLGWEQLQARAHLARHLVAMEGGPIRSVVPTTTATALTSITTGLPPGEHGMVGYRLAVESQVLNVLRWSVEGKDARQQLPPAKLQGELPFVSQRPPVVTRAEFATSGFTEAHLEPMRFHGYRMPSTLAVEVVRLLQAGEPFVYAYYDGIDKVAHEYGLGEHYAAELVALDQIVGHLRANLPPGAALVVTSDHGQVDVGESLVRFGTEVTRHVSMMSGEGRFRWLHARPGHAGDLFAAVSDAHGDQAWVQRRDDLLDAGWFGPKVTDAARARLGDVAVVAIDDVAFVDDSDTGPFELVARHGSLTPAEMLVPLLVAVG